MVLSGFLCTDPNGGEGGIWGGGGGLTWDPDEAGTFYFETGNGDPRGGNPPLNAQGFPSDDDYYESVVKVVLDSSTSSNPNSNGWGMHITDYFTPSNVNALDDADEDFGSGSPLVLPDSAGIPGYPHLMVAAGKDGRIFLIDRDNMGKFNANGDNVLNAVYNSSTGVYTAPMLINGSLSTPAYYHGVLYWVSGYNNSMRKPTSSLRLPTPPSHTTLLPSLPFRKQPTGTSDTCPGPWRFRPTVPKIRKTRLSGSWILATTSYMPYTRLEPQHRIVEQRRRQHRNSKIRDARRRQWRGLRRHTERLASFRVDWRKHTGPGAEQRIEPERPGPIGFVRRTALDRQHGVAELCHQLRDSEVHKSERAIHDRGERRPGIDFLYRDRPEPKHDVLFPGREQQRRRLFFRLLSRQCDNDQSERHNPDGSRRAGRVPASGSEVYLNWTNTATNATGFTITPRPTAFSPRMSSRRPSPPLPITTPISLPASAQATLITTRFKRRIRPACRAVQTRRSRRSRMSRQRRRMPPPCRTATLSK